MSSSLGDPSRHSEFASSRRKAGSGQARMALNVILLIFLVNALVSLLISVIVFFVLSRVMGYGNVTTTGPQVATVPMTTTVISPNISLTAPISSGDGGDQSTPDTYIVRSGDNLSEIAIRLGITLEALMSANGIQNPDWIGVGQKLVIPKPGAPKPTATVPQVPTATETSLPFEPPTPVLTQSPTSPVVADGPTTTPGLATPVSSGEGTPFAGQAIEITEIRGRGELANEQVLFVNKGQVSDLNEWTLSDKDGNVYSFPTVVLWSGAELRLHTGEGNDTPTDLYWNQPKAVWNDAGEIATLKNAKGQVILTYHP